MGDGGWGAPHAALLSLPLETGTSPSSSFEKLSILQFFFQVFFDMNSQIAHDTVSVFPPGVVSLKLFNQ